MKPTLTKANGIFTRRRFCRGLAGAPIVCLSRAPAVARDLQAAGMAESPTPAARRFAFGLASYTCRKFDLAATLVMAQRVGLSHLCLKSFHLPLDSSPEAIAAVAAKVRATGLNLYAGGVITMRNETEARKAFAYASDAGLRVIVGAPAPGILPVVNRLVQDYDLRLAIHNHGPGDEDYPTPGSVYQQVRELDPRIGLCIDVGHTVRIGADPIRAVEAYADRLHDLHIKDVTAAQPGGEEVEIGRGIIDVPRLLRALLEVGYAQVVSFEYEKDPDDPLPGLAESVGYVRGALRVIMTKDEARMTKESRSTRPE